MFSVHVNVCAFTLYIEQDCKLQVLKRVLAELGMCHVGL